jgi:DNA primase
VRDAADLVALIGEHVELRRTGSDYRGPCPFHGGTHRNFAVIPRKQMFYCFVCHEAGDIFTFYMKRSGMDYPTAVREVARLSGISIPERPVGGPDPREPLFSAVSVAAEWYARRLREGDDARRVRDYLGGRDFDLERLAPLGLGFAPKGSEFLEAMDTLGIGIEVLRAAGLAVEREDGSLRPRFWNRLLFPIHDLRGRVVGFGGRIVGEGEPKYLNSPDSPIFHKGRLLYQLHEAKHAIRKAERAVIVEGYFDVLRLVDAGVEEAVAPLGTALTRDQADLLKRYTKSVVLLYDNDAAGLRASFRAADELLRAGLRVAVATLPPGEDPDTLVRAGGRDAVRRVLDDALDVLERKLQLLERKGWFGSVAGRRRALDRLIPTLRAAVDPVTRDLYIGRTADALGVSLTSIAREVDGGGRRGPRPPARDPGLALDQLQEPNLGHQEAIVAWSGPLFSRCRGPRRRPPRSASRCSSCARRASDPRAWRPGWRAWWAPTPSASWPRPSTS